MARDYITTIIIIFLVVSSIITIHIILPEEKVDYKEICNHYGYKKLLNNGGNIYCYNNESDFLNQSYLILNFIHINNYDLYIEVLENGN
jgi:hypothetical protein